MKELINILKGCCPMVDFTNEKHLWSDRIIDSMDMVIIMSALEERYGISIEFRMITPDNFDSAETIFALVNKLKHGEE